MVSLEIDVTYCGEVGGQAAASGAAHVRVLWADTPLEGLPEGMRNARPPSMLLNARTS
jgi:hypothetical protein